ncbi:MAG: hypothetical protein ACI9VR_001465, partial [Cognaticolwellia sp.]
EEENAAPEIEIPGPCRMARKASVTLGFEGEDTVEMSEGPGEGAQLIVVGQSGMRDETRVRLAGDPKVEPPEPEADPDAEVDPDAEAEPKPEANAGSDDDEQEG